MALQLMKLLVTGTSVTEIAPQQEKFFYVTAADTAAGDTLTIDAADFFDDTGLQVTELPALVANNSVYNVFINGVLQMEGLSTYTPGATTVGSLAIALPVGGDSILAASPIVLEIINFDPTSTITLNT